MRALKATTGVEPEHFGYLLREARLRTGRSLDDLARRTKISAVMLERLERGETDALPADVFVCGFLRAYAREVGVSADDAVARYRKAVSGTGVAAQVHQIDRHPAVEHVSEMPQPIVDGEPAAPWSLDKVVDLVTARVPGVEVALGRGPTFALVVLLVVLVATITLSLLLGGDPRPGRGLS